MHGRDDLQASSLSVTGVLVAAASAQHERNSFDCHIDLELFQELARNKLAELPDSASSLARRTQSRSASRVRRAVCRKMTVGINRNASITPVEHKVASTFRWPKRGTGRAAVCALDETDAKMMADSSTCVEVS